MQYSEPGHWTGQLVDQLNAAFVYADNELLTVELEWAQEAQN